MEIVRAGDLRHRIAIQRVATVGDPGPGSVDPETGYRDPETGYRERAYVVRGGLSAVPAAFLPGPGKETLASDAVRGSVDGRFIIRWSSAAEAIQTGDRIVWRGEAWELKAPPVLDRTARRSITLYAARIDANGP